MTTYLNGVTGTALTSAFRAFRAASYKVSLEMYLARIGPVH